MATTKKLDNKGFSLVELIIVIAIMAILVGVVGTQVIPYIEKSRQSKDLQILSGYCTNMTSAVSNCAAVIDSTADYQITISTSGADAKSKASGAGSYTDGGAAGEDDVLANFIELAGYTAAGDLKLSTIGWESKAAKEATGNVICTYDHSTGVVVYLDGQTKISKVSSK